MLLFIDTTDLHTITFALVDSKIKQVHLKLGYNEHYKTLSYLQKFLRQNKAMPNVSHKLPATRLRQDFVGQASYQLDKILVCSGPGSFTGTRVGVTIAQALGFAWQIPVVAIKKAQVPKDLRKLQTFRDGKKMIVQYNRPAM